MNLNFTLPEATSSTRGATSSFKQKIIGDRRTLVAQSVTPRISTANANDKKRVISRGASVVRKGIPNSEFKQYVKNCFANGEFEKQYKVRAVLVKLKKFSVVTKNEFSSNGLPRNRVSHLPINSFLTL